MNTDENLMVAVPDPDLEIGGVGGGGSSRPLDKIGAPPPNFRRQFGLKIRGGGGGGGGLFTKLRQLRTGLG